MSLTRDRLLSYSEAADLVGRHTRTIRRWVKQGKLRAGGIGRSRWVRESDLLYALGFVGERSSALAEDVEEDDAWSGTCD